MQAVLAQFVAADVPARGSGQESPWAEAKHSFASRRRFWISSDFAVASTSSRADATAAELLAVLAELPGEHPENPSPQEAGRGVLRRGVHALGAAGAAAHVVDSRGQSFEIVEGGAAGGVPTVAAEVAAGGSRLTLWFDEERALSDVERAFLRALVRILAQEVERSSLLVQQQVDARERERARRWADVLNDAFRLSSSRASLKRILDELARVSCETAADFSTIRVLTADRRSLELRALHHRDPEQGELLRATLEYRAMPANLGEMARVLESGESLLLPAIDRESLLRAYAGTPFGDHVARFPVSTVMVVPLASRGTVYGVVTVARIAPEPFQPADLRFLQEIADRAAAAIDNTSLLEKLTHSEGQLRVALEAGRLGAWAWDIPAGKVTWSTMLEQIHGLEAGTFEGTFEAYQRDIHPEDRERVLSTIGRATEERTDHHVVYRIVRPDGEVRWVEGQGRLLYDAAGAPQRLVGVCLDVTERTRSEEQLHQMVLVLRDGDRRKDEFLAMLAHELRNPLGPMLNATHLLRIPGLAEDIVEEARDILDRQVQHMTRLLDDLLDVSRVTRGKVELLREVVDIAALTREVVGDHMESFRAAGLPLDLTVPAGPIVVYADRTRLAQIIVNLLSNALKFSQPGQAVRVRVEATGQDVMLTVRDEGAGIEPALLGSVFEPFVQGDTTFSRARGGLGLGLAVVKGLAVLHGGRVTAASDGVGRGTEIRVALPLHALPTGVAPARRPEPGSREGAGTTVLVFEDNPDAAESLRVVLSAAGYHVCVESTGRDARAAVRRAQPAIILCDLGLPDRDGYAVAEDIRSDRELAPVPLIAISGYGTAEDQTRSRRAGFVVHLTKPVPPGLLLAELSHRLARPASTLGG
jgi:PAS domain S-box-containing protein